MSRKIDREQRRQELANALWNVILKEGMAAVSIRSVAKEAGVVPGSLRYVFPTRAELIMYSARLMIDKVTDRIRTITPPGSAREYALAVIAELLPLDDTRRAEFDINLSLAAEARTFPELREILREASDGLLYVCRRAVCGVRGLPENSADSDIELQAHTLHSLIDGASFRIFQQDPSEGTSWAMQMIEAELERIAAISDV
ncbi:TetR family transcriptional regulator [Corynebacterium falsenii]|uniref:TetR family transcriptional regulator n=1 Tax=Corynebacterium falsenii TaxID=108486 RepID=A0A418Q5H4_9CORY|nr:TetR family transcriptional regulator C-terminal domain-containing protein [Corynebacterium falsenii]RIX33877.1 TetR family transcriptional regulator [Corynebacterium falsenii]